MATIKDILTNSNNYIQGMGILKVSSAPNSLKFCSGSGSVPIISSTSIGMVDTTSWNPSVELKIKNYDPNGINFIVTLKSIADMVNANWHRNGQVNIDSKKKPIEDWEVDLPEIK